jgi:hypothetical protein
MSDEAKRWAEQVRTRGFALLPDVYPAETLIRIDRALDAVHARYGSPALTGQGARWLDEGVEIAPPGLALYGLLRFVPELAPHLFRPEPLAVLEAVLGSRMHLELVGAVLSDESRPFTEWESHAGGIDDERWRKTGKRPRRDSIVRMVHFLFVDPLTEDGPWQLLPRAVGDPVDPAGDIHRPDWPGARPITASAGSVLLLEESVWHSVRPLATPGRRRFVGSYFASPEAEVPIGRDSSLDALAEAGDSVLQPLVRHRPSAHAERPSER